MKNSELLPMVPVELIGSEKRQRKTVFNKNNIHYLWINV